MYYCVCLPAYIYDDNIVQHISRSDTELSSPCPNYGMSTTAIDVLYHELYFKKIKEICLIICSL